MDWFCCRINNVIPQREGTHVLERCLAKSSFQKVNNSWKGKYCDFDLALSSYTTSTGVFR